MRAALWISGETNPDTTAAFRGAFELPADGVVTLRISGAHVFTAWLDGVHLTEGPYRFPPGHPEFETLEIPLARGRHVLAAMVRHDGINTRLMQGSVIPPFFFADLWSEEASIPLSWKAQRLKGYLASGQRVSPQFAWIEWVDTRLDMPGWHGKDFDDSSWPQAIEVESVGAWAWRPIEIERVKRMKVEPRKIGDGVFSGAIAHEERPDWKTDDDLPWYHRDLQGASDVNGTWRRYDLGHVMLVRPEFTLDIPAGTVVEIAYSESLREGRVTPFIPLSCGLSRNLDHFVARGGRQTFAPLVPKGGRFMEIHVGAPPDKVRFLQETYWQRTYYGEPVGDFVSGDDLLDRIWRLGINTLRGCSEDAITDNPTRERGQWTGDVLLGLPIAAAAYNDVRLFKRALFQAAWCANADGLVAGLCPGDPGYLSTYAAQWTSAALNYFFTTGDRHLLGDLFPFAVRNIDAFNKELSDQGINFFAWPFIDWGYPGSVGSDGTEMGLNMHVLESARGMQTWCQLLEKDPTPYREFESRLVEIILAWLTPRLRSEAWEAIGFHCVTLALRNRLIPEDLRPAAIAFLKRHILSCFPNDADAPRLINPEFKSNRLITPYFAHYYLPELIEAGEMDFVLDQYRACWGWGLKQGLTTQAEVFDLGWSHCHIWASSPTAQISHYLLGLRAHFSAGLNHFYLTLNPGSCKKVGGKIPLLSQSGAIAISWKMTASDCLQYEIETPQPIWIHSAASSKPISVSDRARLILKSSAAGWRIVD